MNRVRIPATMLRWMVASCAIALMSIGANAFLPGRTEPRPSYAIPLCSSSFHLFDLIPSPTYDNDRTIFLAPIYGYSSQVWRSINNGITWEVIYQAPGFNEEVNNLTAIRVPGDTGVTLYIRHWHHRRNTYGIARSTDAGITWQERTACDPNCLGIFPTNRPETIFAIRGEPPVVFESGMGILRSDDGGLSWQTVWEETNIWRLFVSPTFAQDMTLFGKADSLIGSSDGGITWRRLDDEAGPNHMVAFSPDFAHDHTAFGVSTHTLFKSQDAGLSWQPMFLFSGDLWGADLDISPNFVEDRTLFMATENAVLASYDDGANWSVIASGVQEPRLDVRRRVGDSNQVGQGIGDLRQERNSPDGIASPAVRATLNHQTYLPLAGKTGLRTRPLSLFLSTQAGSNFHYYHSDDGGLTWNCLNVPPAQ